MSFELRLSGAPPAQFDTEDEAIAAARQALQTDPNAEPEVIDLTTGKPCAPAADKSWREDLKNRVGF